jgi:hypothetical protein
MPQNLIRFAHHYWNNGFRAIEKKPGSSFESTNLWLTGIKKGHLFGHPDDFGLCRIRPLIQDDLHILVQLEAHDDPFETLVSVRCNA